MKKDFLSVLQEVEENPDLPDKVEGVDEEPIGDMGKDEIIDEIFEFEIYGDFDYKNIERFFKYSNDDKLELENAKLTLELSGKVSDREKLIKDIEDKFPLRLVEE